MNLSTWLRKLAGKWCIHRQPKGGRRTLRIHRRILRPRLESLEDRTLLSGGLPYPTATTAAQLIADINQANQNGGANTIALGANIAFSGGDNFTNGINALPVIAAGDNLTIVGKNHTIDGQHESGRLFDVVSGASLTLQNLTLTGGLALFTRGLAEGGAFIARGL